MADLQGQMGELRMTVQVTRKETGEVETHELVGYATQEQAEALGAQTGEQPKED